MNTTTASDTIYKAEIDFLNRKLPTANIKWQSLSALSQLASPPLSDAEANNLIAQYKSIMADAAKQNQVLFNKMVFTVASKLRGGIRVAVSIPLLRQVFGHEIDGVSGGGGRGYNPLTTRPTRGRGI